MVDFVGDEINANNKNHPFVSATMMDFLYGEIIFDTFCELTTLGSAGQYSDVGFVVVTSTMNKCCHVRQTVLYVNEMTFDISCTD